MNEPRVVEIRCPHCGQIIEKTVYDVVNVTFEPPIKDRVLDQSIFTTRCPHCKQNVALLYPFLYVDLKNKFLIQVCSPNEVDTYVRGLKANMSSLKNTLGAYFEACSYRIVDSYLSFLEKIYIFEGGYDDKVFELMKVILWNMLSATHDEKELNNYYLYAQEDGFKLDVINVDNQTMRTHHIKKSMYQEIKEEFEQYFYEVDAKFAVINYQWAINYIKKHKKGNN